MVATEAPKFIEISHGQDGLFLASKLDITDSKVELIIFGDLKSSDCLLSDFIRTSIQANYRGVPTLAIPDHIQSTTPQIHLVAANYCLQKLGTIAELEGRNIPYSKHNCFETIVPSSKLPLIVIACEMVYTQHRPPGIEALLNNINQSLIEQYNLWRENHPPITEVKISRSLR